MPDRPAPSMLQPRPAAPRPAPTAQLTPTNARTPTPAPAVQIGPAVQTWPAVPAAPAVQAAPAVPAGLALRTGPAVRAALALLYVTMQATFSAAAPAQDQDRDGGISAALARVVAAYSAKVAASALFVSGRTLASVRAEELAPNGPLQALAAPALRLVVDQDARSVTAALLGQRATATFLDGIGCTLATGGDLDRLRGLAAAAPAPAPDARPWPLGDTRTSPPDDIDRPALQQALAYGFAGPEDGPPIGTRAIVVVGRGRLLAERYAAGYDAQTALPGWSMTKSIIDALLGIRVGDGALDPGAELPVPEWQAGQDPRRAVRLDDLMRMQSGLGWTEDYESPNSDTLRMLFGSRDYGAIAAGEPLAREPGTEFRYSSGTTNLLCRILRSTFADDAAYLTFARRRLFAPLGMHSALIEPDPGGTLVGSSFGFATARDWAKLGLLYLQDGIWNGQRILPEGWVRDSTTPTGCAEQGNYGRHWWLNRGPDDAPAQRPFARLPRDAFYMSGYEGQYVVCFPTEQLIVARLGCTRRGGLDLQGLLERVLRACTR